MLYLTCTMISSVDLAHYRVSGAKYWVSVDCGTNQCTVLHDLIISGAGFQCRILVQSAGGEGHCT